MPSPCGVTRPSSATHCGGAQLIAAPSALVAVEHEVAEVTRLGREEELGLERSRYLFLAVVVGDHGIRHPDDRGRAENYPPARIARESSQARIDGGT